MRPSQESYVIIRPITGEPVFFFLLAWPKKFEDNTYA